MILQSTLLPHFSLEGARPNLVLVLVCGWSLLRGPKEGSLWALIAGIALDLLSGAPFSLGTFSLLAVSLLSGWGQFRQFQSTLLLPVVVILMAAFLHDLFFLVGLRLMGWPVPWTQVMLSSVLPGTLLTAALAPFVYPLLRRFSARLGSADAESALELAGSPR